MEWLIAIIGLLLGALGITGGVAASRKTKNDHLEKKVEQAEGSAAAQEKIMQEAVSKKPLKTIIKKGNGNLPHFVLLCIFVLPLLSSCSIAKVTSTCPAIPIIERGEFSDVVYTYDNGSYIFTEIEFDSLAEQWLWSMETISKYENMLRIYEAFRKGEKK